MRILMLDVEGFGPFRDRQVLDFAAAASGGLMLISGRTGAGKSSLLDAVSFALYGAVPRYDGQVSRVRSDHSAPTSPTLVRLDFEIAGERYRVERSPEYTRPAKRGGGTTTQKTEAALWRWDEAAGEWEGLASRPVDVAALLTPVLRLNHQQFLQVVMLSQGGFQRFLRASDDERQTTLRTLFQTGRYTDIEEALVERRKLLDAAVRESEARIEGLLGGLEDALARDAAADGPAEAGAEPAAAAAGAAPDAALSLAERRNHATLAVAALELRASELQAIATDTRGEQREAAVLLEQARTLAAAQQRLFRAEARGRELEEQRAAIDELRAELDAADRAALVEREQRRLESARREQRDAAERWDARWEALQPALAEPDGRAASVAALSADTAWDELAAALTQDRDAATALHGSLRESREDERRLGELREETATLRDALTEAQTASATETAKLAELPERLDTARTSRELAALEAALVEQRALEATRAAAQLSAARRVEQLTAALTAAQQESATLAEAAAARTAAVSHLLTRRIAGMAGELADELRDGEPCAVCGSPNHPAPASHADPVTPELIDAAEAAQRTAQAALDTARTTERAAETALVAATAEAGELTPGAAQEALDAANEQLELARAAADTLSGLEEHIAAVEAEQASRNAHLSELGVRAASLTASIAAQESQATALAAELETAKSEFATIAERIDRLETLRASLEAALTAGGARAAAVTALQQAEESFAAELVAQGFAEAESDAEELAHAAEAAVAAHRADEAREGLRERVRTFDADTQRNAGELAAPDLADLERTPVELDPVTAAAAAAGERADAALARHAAAQRIAAEHRATLERVERELTGSAATGEELLTLRRLADTVQGKDPNTKRMRLEVFVLAARLEAIVAAANRRLSTMVGGRYRLAHDDGLRARGRQSGLGLAVIDEYTGRSRTTDSLSGGESFLASLALALGLADVVTAESGGLQLDTLFIDEGFGSLDPDALDQALATLDGLREGGRTVALISHVAELKERLAGGIEVVADGQGVSSLRGDGVLSPDEANAETRERVGP